MTLTKEQYFDVKHDAVFVIRGWSKVVCKNSQLIERNYYKLTEVLNRKEEHIQDSISLQETSPQIQHTVSFTKIGG